MNNKSIRFMKRSDAKTILSIYEPYIEKTSITFECKTPSLNYLYLNWFQVFPILFASESEKWASLSSSVERIKKSETPQPWNTIL